MTPTTTGDAETSPDDGVKLRLDVYDKLVATHGPTTPTEQAAFHGISRAHMYRLRKGDREPSLDLALRIAADLGVTVEDLFERAA